MEEVGIKDGERHDQMMRLARDMRHIVENNPKAVWYYLLKQKFVKDLIREGDNVERDVKDALAYKYTTYMPKVFQKVLKKHAEDIHKSNPNQMSKETIYEQYRRYGESFKALFAVPQIRGKLQGSLPLLSLHEGTDAQIRCVFLSCRPLQRCLPLWHAGHPLPLPPLSRA